MNTLTTSTQSEQNMIRMFAVISVSPNQKQFFQIKHYKNRDYIFVHLRKIVNNKNLTRNSM